jgi:hypothetical protein
MYTFNRAGKEAGAHVTWHCHSANYHVFEKHKAGLYSLVCMIVSYNFIKFVGPVENKNRPLLTLFQNQIILIFTNCKKF